MLPATPAADGAGRLSGPVEVAAGLAVIVVTFNSAGTIGEAITSICAHLPLAEVIVVDNGSTDATLKCISAPNVRLVRSDENLGFGTAVNLGARATERDVLLILNPDARILSASLAEIGAWSGSLSGLLTCAIASGPGHHFPWHPDWGWRRELVWSLGQWLAVPRELSLHRPTARHGRRATWVSGAAMVARRSEFLSVGGFDERMFLYFEDVDISRRFRRQGLAIGATAALVVEHVGQGSSAGRNEEQIQGWALLSLLELVAIWSGPREARRAARALMRILRFVAIAGRLVGRAPLIGARAQAKARAAVVIQANLVASVTTPPRIGAYPQARAALADVTRS